MNRKLVKLLIAITSAFLCLTGCRRNTAEPIILPTVDDICSINIELIDGRQMSYENSESIKQIISAISIGKATNKESVQDFPSEDEYGTINIESNDGTTTVFIMLIAENTLWNSHIKVFTKQWATLKIPS